jgi:hypothetical protein
MLTAFLVISGITVPGRALLLIVYTCYSTESTNLWIRETWEMNVEKTKSTTRDTSTTPGERESLSSQEKWSRKPDLSSRAKASTGTSNGGASPPALSSAAYSAINSFLWNAKRGWEQRSAQRVCVVMVRLLRHI